MPGHRKRVKHYHQPGDSHELTFSCYQRKPLLTDDERRRMLCESIGRALVGRDFRLIAIVLMPDHVHLLVYPIIAEPETDRFLFAVKRPFSYRVKQRMEETSDPLLKELTIRERPGKTTFRFWQEGPGYDRNLSSEKAVLSAIDYIHENPVRRGLVSRAHDWKWSSAAWYASDRQKVEPDLPRIHGLPWEFFVRSQP